MNKGKLALGNLLKNSGVSFLQKDIRRRSCEREFLAVVFRLWLFIVPSGYHSMHTQQTKGTYMLIMAMSTFLFFFVRWV